MRCFELGPAGVDAGDVASAEVVTSRATGTDEVTFTLSPAGTMRFNAMARAVGLGGQAAMVVDGVVVSAPRIQVLEFSGSGVVTGLDAAAAQRLAKRLNRD